MKAIDRASLDDIVRELEGIQNRLSDKGNLWYPAVVALLAVFVAAFLAYIFGDRLDRRRCKSARDDVYAEMRACAEEIEERYYELPNQAASDRDNWLRHKQYLCPISTPAWHACLGHPRLAVFKNMDLVRDFYWRIDRLNAAVRCFVAEQRRLKPRDSLRPLARILCHIRKESLCIIHHEDVRN